MHNISKHLLTTISALTWSCCAVATIPYDFSYHVFGTTAQIPVFNDGKFTYIQLNNAQEIHPPLGAKVHGPYWVIPGVPKEFSFKQGKTKISIIRTSYPSPQKNIDLPSKTPLKPTIHPKSMPKKLSPTPLETHLSLMPGDNIRKKLRQYLSKNSNLELIWNHPGDIIISQKIKFSENNLKKLLVSLFKSLKIRGEIYQNQLIVLPNSHT